MAAGTGGRSSSFNTSNNGANPNSFVASEINLERYERSTIFLSKYRDSTNSTNVAEMFQRNFLILILSSLQVKWEVTIKNWQRTHVYAAIVQQFSLRYRPRLVAVRLIFP